MRKINSIILHCTDTNSDNNIGVDEITKWHLRRGFVECGYHFIIKVDGRIEFGRDVIKVGAHCKGQNAHSIGICLVGGRKDDKPCLDGTWLSKAQCQTLTLLCAYLFQCFGVLEIHAHNEFNAAKTCPNFDVEPFKKFMYEKFQSS